MINVLLAGGSGTRLWPLSRKKLPKQFVRMFSGASLFQKTLMRNQSLVDDFLCVANKEHFYLALDQSDCVLSSNITFLNEPVGRNSSNY